MTHTHARACADRQTDRRQRSYLNLSHDVLYSIGTDNETRRLLFSLWQEAADVIFAVVDRIFLMNHQPYTCLNHSWTIGVGYTFARRPGAKEVIIFILFFMIMTASLSSVFVNHVLRSMPCDAECRRFRQLLHSWPADKPKAAVILLLQPSSVDKVARSSRLFSANFNNAYGYPVIVFHEENMNNEVDRQRLRLLFNSSLYFQVWRSISVNQIFPYVSPNRSIPLSNTFLTLGWPSLCNFACGSSGRTLLFVDWTWLNVSTNTVYAIRETDFTGQKSQPTVSLSKYWRNIKSTQVAQKYNKRTNLQTRKPTCRWQTRVTRKHAKIAPIRRAYNVVAVNTGLSSFVYLLLRPKSAKSRKILWKLNL